MSETPTSTIPVSHLCYLCGRKDGLQIPFAELPEELLNLLKANLTDEKQIEQVCANCLHIFSRAQEQLKSHPDIFTDTERALPTPVRMDADVRFTGREITIAFLDSGFYAHKDLTQPINRIVAYHSIFTPEDDPTLLQTTDVASWHGMMTSVVAAGNGYLSDGLYRGIAPDANVVL